MGRPELGTKCTCAACQERFYDLNRSPVVCPKCGAQQPPPAARVARPSRGTFGAGAHPRRVPATAVIDDEAAAADASEAENEDDDAELDEEADDDIEVEPADARTAE